MSDQPNTPLNENNDPEDLPENLAPEETSNLENMDETPADAANEAPENMNARLERLGGEPAPDITPEEFARLRQSGQIHIDPRGRVRSRRQDGRDEGVSLRKRRAWYVNSIDS